jgi:glutathione S-transferase
MAPRTVAPLTLVSHKLCAYVQRAAIVLAEKGAPSERRWVDLTHKPEWFRAISPLGKTPVLLVGSTPVFESAVICEYLDDTVAPRLHPVDPLQRARHRGWMEFGSALLNAVAGFYSAADETALRNKAGDIRARFEQVEAELAETADGPYFAGAAFCIVDAAFAPVFRYFDAFDEIGDFGCLRGLPKVVAWRAALAQRDSVHSAVGVDYAPRLRDFLRARNSALSAHMRLPLGTSDRGLSR